MEETGKFDARYLAFLETISQLRPQLHRYCSRMTGSITDGEDAEVMAAEPDFIELAEPFGPAVRCKGSLNRQLGPPPRIRPLRKSSGLLLRSERAVDLNELREVHAMP